MQPPTFENPNIMIRRGVNLSPFASPSSRKEIETEAPKSTSLRLSLWNIWNIWNKRNIWNI